MKVVLFCGGLGTRLRDSAGEIPKPMVKIGYRPILWHVMKYYAHFGHKDFVLCLGYKADVIKEFFLKYEEWISNDFTLTKGGRELSLERSDIDDWSITCPSSARASSQDGLMLAPPNGSKPVNKIVVFNAFSWICRPFATAPCPPRHTMRHRIEP